jgi:hypothetical protein
MAVQKRGDPIKKLTPSPSSGEHHRRKNVRCKREHHRLSICCSDRPQARSSGRRILRAEHARAVLWMSSRRTQSRKLASAETRQAKRLRDRQMTTNTVPCPRSRNLSWVVLETLGPGYLYRSPARRVWRMRRHLRARRGGSAGRGSIPALASTLRIKLGKASPATSLSGRKRVPSGAAVAGGTSAL